MALTSNVEPLSVLDEIGETTIAQRMSMVDGVSQVMVWGPQKYAVRIAAQSAGARVARASASIRSPRRSTRRT